MYACGCAALVLCALSPAAAHATVPGHWDAVTSPTGGVSDQVALLRDRNGSLHVVWHQDPPGSPTAALMQTMVSASGKVGPAQTIVSGWLRVGDATIMRAANGRLLVIAGATRTLSPTDPFTSTEEWTSSDDGATWTISPQPVTHSSGVDAGALATDGVTPIVAWSTTDGLFLHRGTDPDTPNANLQTAAGLNCCAVNPAVVADGANGTIVVAWYSDASQGDAIYARTVDPATGAPTGTTLRMPGSLGSDGPIQRVALTAISGQPGTYVAQTLSSGFTSSRLLVWKVGSATSTTLATFPSSGAPPNPAIAATPDGRLWVAWSAKGRIWARRSNRQRTAWGATTSIPVAPHTDTVYKLAVNAQAGVLDILAAFSPSPAGDVQTWHSQIEPGLTVLAKPSKVRVGKGRRFKLKIAVSDAGIRVAHATVSVGGHRLHTGAGGTVAVKLGPFNRPSTIHVTARHTGYTPAATTVRVRPR